MNKTILIVEDDAILALDLQRMISQQDYTVVGPIASGEEAIDYLIDNTVDLVLMDIELDGEMNGITTAETLNRTSDIPIVFLTGYSQDPLLDQAMIAAPYIYIIKPVPERELAATLQMVLHRHMLDRNLKESKIALAKSEERLHMAQEAAQSGMWEWNVTTNEHIWSDELWKLYGLDPKSSEAVSNMATWQRTVHPDDRAGVEEKFRKATFSRSELHVEWRVVLQDGTTRWLMSKGKPSFDSKGQVTYYLGIVIDITERKRAEELTQNRIMTLTQPMDGLAVTIEELFSLDEIQRIQNEFAEATGVASIVTLPDGTPITSPTRFTYLCSEIIRKTEKGCANCYKSDAYIGCYHPDGPIVQTCLSGGLWDAGVSVIVGDHHIANWLIGQVRNERQSEEKMRAYAAEIGADESLFMKAFYEVPAMSFDQFHRIAQLLFTLVNQLCNRAYQNVQQARFINEIEKTEEALRENEEKFRTMASHTYDWEYWTDPNGRLIYTSPSCERTTGYKAESFLHDPDLLNSIIHPDDRGRFIQHRIEATQDAAGLDCHKSVFRILDQSGEESWIEHICKEVFDRQGKSLGRRVSHRDITEWKTAERALQINTAHLQSVFRAAPVGIGVVANRVLNQVNDRFCEMTGYTPEELINKSSRILYPDEFGFEFVGMEKYRQISLKGTGTVETQWCRKDGSVIDVLLSSTPFDTADLAKGVTFTALDITERKLAENALLKRKSYFRALFENAGDAIIIENMQDRIIDANPQACELFGYTREKLLQLYVPDLQAPENRGARGSVIKNELARNNKALFETVDVRKDGVRVPVEVKTVPFRADNEDLALSIVRDITERKKAAFERERLVQAIEQSGETIVITDLEGVIQYANPAFEKITGHSSKEAVGKKTNFLKSGCHDDIFYRDLWGTISGGNTWKGQIINVKKDGTLYTEDATISPVIGTDGSIVNYIAVKADITEKIKSDKEKALLEAQYIQAQKMEAIGRLAGGVAHDFNNMLSVIIGYAEIAQGKNDTCDLVGKELAAILEAAEKSADIVKQLLAFARKQTISPKIINLNDTVEDMLKMLRRLIGEDIDLAWIPMKQLWPVKADPSQIDQILANLCVNARDAIIDVGKVTIETGMVNFDTEYCATHAGFIPGDFVSLVVSDNGCGIEKDGLDLIFEPFFTSKEVGRGTGLGLATVYGIVKQNHGFINVYSEFGEGTTFKIYLPRTIENTENVLQKRSHLIPQGDGESVLLVEDEPALLQLAQEMLQRLGYLVLPAANPMDALKFLEGDEITIDLLITDVVMPGMNGRELAGKITAACPGVKVLFMSGYTANVIVHHGVLDDNINFIQKPFTKKELATKVKEVLVDKNKNPGRDVQISIVN